MCATVNKRRRDGTNILKSSYVEVYDQMYGPKSRFTTLLPL